MKAPAILLGVSVAAVVALALANTSAGSGKLPLQPTNDPRPQTGEGLEYVRQLAIVAGAPKDWQDFFVLVAERESGGGHPLVGRGSRENAPPYVKMNPSVSETHAAQIAYDRNRDAFRKCWPPAAYGFGSGGLFAMLPANGLVAFKGTELVCLHPWAVFDGPISMIMAIWYARRLTLWAGWTGTVLSLRVGWGSPTSMGDDGFESRKRSEYVQDCLAAGLPGSFIDHKLSSWKPSPADELFSRFGANRGWLP